MDANIASYYIIDKEFKFSFYSYQTFQKIKDLIVYYDRFYILMILMFISIQLGMLHKLRFGYYCYIFIIRQSLSPQIDS